MIGRSMDIQQILEKKRRGEKITVLTAYDHPTAAFLDEAGIDIILVGDSLANVVLGLESTKDVGMTEMLHHAGAVVRAVKNALVVGDMPYSAYQPCLSGRQAHARTRLADGPPLGEISPKPADSPRRTALDNARQFMDLGCKAVKLEWFEDCAQTAGEIIKAGIPVMGHVGLTPQTAEEMKVRGKDAASAKVILEETKKLEEAGCFSVVLECIPMELARLITTQLRIPTIGIGAGPHCDGQVLVTHDLLGLFDRYAPKFSKKYADLSAIIRAAAKAYKQDVTEGRFPDDAHSFHMSPDELKKL